MSDTDLALAVARRFSPSGMLDRGDYEGIALFAVWRARKRYREGTGARFASYAWHFAAGDIRHALRDTADSAEPLPGGWEAAAPGMTPEGIVLDREAVERIWGAVDALPPMQALAVRKAIEGGTRSAAEHRALFEGRRKLAWLRDGR
jgi:hypothetical protein